MMSKKSVWRTGLAVAALFVAATALGQVNSDWPNLKGGNNRTGKNRAPNATGPGRGLLHWFAPNNPLDLTEILLDNTDVPNTETAFPGQGPFDPPLFNSTVNSGYYNPLNPSPNPSTGWAWPSITEEAPFAFLLPRRSEPQTIGATAYPVDYNSRFPAYLYTRVTPSSTSGDSRQPADPTKLRPFFYRFGGPANSPRSYALYAWIPVGPTYLGSTRLFPQRYFVYEIRTGPSASQRYIDVVDTYSSGGGWVRLGARGAPTNIVFPWDGTNEIIVRLLNTVPRDENGQLTMPHPAGNENGVEQYVVYADAMKAVPARGTYAASPTAGRLVDTDPNSLRLFEAKTEYSVATDGRGTRTVAQGGLTTRAYNNLTKAWDAVWTYTPTVEQPEATTTLDNSVAAVAGAFAPETTSTRFAGTDVYTANIQATANSTVTYAPTLNPGSYSLNVYLPGDNNGLQFGRGVVYQVLAEGQVFTYTVDQSLPRGWVPLGDRRFTHTVAEPIRVVVTNESALAADLTRQAYADAVRFVGERNLAITSTPVYATARIRKSNGNLEDTKVVIVADESGVIRCLDAAGNADGTTIEYWSYPSQTTPDPNQVAGIDGIGGLAEMPTSFDLSTALVQRLSGFDYLYIGSTNGRVYCIEMTGRGDYEPRKAGTAIRRWIYPSTYPSSDAIPSSQLGAFTGSMVYGNPGDRPTIYVPTTQGRLYALDARGQNATKSTSVRWAYPAINQPTLGEIQMTPSFEFDNLYFGTRMKDDSDGQFFCLNGLTGAVVWQLGPDSEAYDDFLSSPAVATYQQLDGSADPGGILYTVNQNNVFYAIDALTGNILWRTNELSVGARASLTFTRMSVFDNAGLPSSQPVVVVPTLDGRWSALFAHRDPGFVNRFGGKRAWEYVAAGDTIIASNAVAQGWMFGADNVGFLYAFADNSGNLGTGDPQPGQQTIVENNPAGDLFRKAKMKFITREAYQALRLPTGDAGQLTYQQAISPASTFNRSPLAFEWGETIYVLIYDFPYRVTDTNGNNVPPPLVNVSFSVRGRAYRVAPGAASQFRNLGSPNPPELNEVEPNVGMPPSPEGDIPLDGYAVVPFPFQNGGNSAIPPGEAQVAFTISTQSLNAGRAQQNIALDPTLSRQTFTMANPIGISARLDASGNPVPEASIGIDVNPSGPERRVNGSPRMGAARKDLIGISTGWAQHGQSADSRLFVYDTSMMGLLREEGLGLDNVRLVRSDLNRQGGASAVYKALDPALYPGFEDLPVNFPNTSIDYPDIPREQVRATKDPNGNTENPLFNGVQLYAPLIRDGATLRPMQDGDRPEDRVFRPTIFDLTVDVPRYQPPVDLSANPGAIVPNSEGAGHTSGYLQGYMGRLSVLVDSRQNGSLDTDQRESFRSFNLATAVAPDEGLAVTTPTVDLGSLPTGAGYSAVAMPGFGFNPLGSTNRRLYNPWGGDYANLFKEFSVQNRGNVNMLNLRLAKAFDSRLVNPGSPREVWPFKIPGTTNDPFSWLETGWGTSGGNLFTGNIWSDMDWQFSPWPEATYGKRAVMLQKPRVVDRVPSELTVNPRRRANPNIGATDSPLFLNVNRFPVRSPRVSATIPIGMPSGPYRQRLRIIEDTTAAADTFPTWDLISTSNAEAASDPTFDLVFTVRETRLTNSFTPGTDRMIDFDMVETGGVPTPYAQGTMYSHSQPTAMRDPFGSLILAFTSNRPVWRVDPTVPADTNRQNRIFFASLDNLWTFNSGGMAGPGDQSAVGPLRDLNNWNSASSGRWWRRQQEGFPNRPTDTELFKVGAGETLIDSTVSYGNASFPQTGMASSFDPTTTYRGTYVAFTGTAQKSTPSGRVNMSQLMAAQVTVDASGDIAVTRPSVASADTTIVKGKPTLVQTDTGAMVFYAGMSGSQSRLYYTRIEGRQFGPASALPLGTGFESVARPSAAGRTYQGLYSGSVDRIIDLTFGGKLKGRPNTEVFMARLRVNGDRLAENPSTHILDEANAFLWLPVQYAEPLSPESSETFRTRGLAWNLQPREQPSGSFEPAFDLVQTLNGTTTRLLLDGWTFTAPNTWTYNAAQDTRQYDPGTGIISYETRLGGRAFFDPNVGTVRFSGGTPASAARVTLTYQPAVLRVTAGANAGYVAPTGMWDGRLITDAYDYQYAIGSFGSRYWRRADGSVAQANDGVAELQRYRNDRMVFTYNRAASGAGQAARPYLSTMRLGVRLPTRVQTNAEGAPVNVVVTGNIGPYQVDPAQGRIYFTSVDEDRPVQVTYWGIDDAGNPITSTSGGRNLTANAAVSYVGERAEEPILIEQAVNESALTPFLDPFTYLNDRRPPSIWLFWSSTRAGQPDLYFQTIAPNWSPIPLGR